MMNKELGSQVPFSPFIISLIGIAFLLAYWFFGFDGITFSDDVYYILAGRSFWEGTMEVNEYHFSSRWGAYIPFGFFGWIFGFSPKVFSLFSLICYLVTYLLFLRMIRMNDLRLVFTLWFVTQVYFLHFLTKVYPDSALVLWVSLVPICAYHRMKRPTLAGLGFILALFVGFVTKETIVFLAPFPFILFFLDWKQKQVKKSFYISFFLGGFILASLYLAYFWIQFGDPLFRIHSINAGHYISEFTYADKGLWSILKRLTILPFVTFVERAYWPWLVFALPGLYFGLRKKTSSLLECSVALLCLLLGFWFMSSTLELYNPIYLNPRHLIILVPLLSFVITQGWTLWSKSKKWRFILTVFLFVGILIALLIQDWQMALFHFAFLPLLWIKKPRIRWSILASILIIPALLAIPYQFSLKKYQNLISTLDELTQKHDDQTILLINNFIFFSQDVLLPEKAEQQKALFPIENILQLQRYPPDEIRVMIYEYYAHAYPQEQADVNNLELWIKINNYRVIEEYREDRIWFRKLSRALD
ncbi:hypothetical protein [Algoriphagus namhaensis]